MGFQTRPLVVEGPPSSIKFPRPVHAEGHFTWLAHYCCFIVFFRRRAGPPVQTTEGVKPLVEVIAFLKTTAALEPLESKEGMQQAAADHVK